MFVVFISFYFSNHSQITKMINWNETFSLPWRHTIPCTLLYYFNAPVAGLKICVYYSFLVSNHEGYKTICFYDFPKPRPESPLHWDTVGPLQLQLRRLKCTGLSQLILLKTFIEDSWAMFELFWNEHFSLPFCTGTKQYCCYYEREA